MLDFYAKKESLPQGNGAFGGTSLLPLLPPGAKPRIVPTSLGGGTAAAAAAAAAAAGGAGGGQTRQRDTKVRQPWVPKKAVVKLKTAEEDELDELDLSDAQARVLEAICQRRNIFYTGAAGTGKSFILKIVQQVFQYVKKENQLSITATTGIAACNVRGMTIHSWSGVGIGTDTLEQTVVKASRNKAVKQRWQETETLVIDEVSMLSAELLEKISAIGKRCRSDSRPFGGMQVILCGDFLQLPPVGLGSDCHFCFTSPVWHELLGSGGMMVLDKVFRQRDPRFLRVLNELRRGVVSPATEELLQSKVRDASNMRKAFVDKGQVTTKLFSVNSLVDKVNNTELNKLGNGIDQESGTARSYVFKAKDEGESHLLKGSRVPETIELRIGAEVMLLKNLSTSDGLVNGARGRVVRFELNPDFEEAQYAKTAEGFPDNLRFFPVVEFCIYLGAQMTKLEHLVKTESWDVTQGQKVLAQRTQIPLMLSWAMSIHKAQGMTIPLLEVSTDRSFEYGQVYVALSRAVSLEGLVLNDFSRHTVKCHSEVMAFYKSVLGVSADAAEVEEDASVHTSVTELVKAFQLYLPEVEDVNDGWVENKKIANGGGASAAGGGSGNNAQLSSLKRKEPDTSHSAAAAAAAAAADWAPIGKRSSSGPGGIDQAVACGDISREELESAWSAAPSNDGKAEPEQQQQQQHRAKAKEGFVSAAAVMHSKPAPRDDVNPFSQFAFQVAGSPPPPPLSGSLPPSAPRAPAPVPAAGPALPPAAPAPPLVLTDEQRRRVAENRANALAKKQQAQLQAQNAKMEPQP